MPHVKILPPFVARFVIICGTNCQLFCQPTSSQEKNHDYFCYAPLIFLQRITVAGPESKADRGGSAECVAASYPEIMTATVTGPEALGAKLLYTFSKAIGTKG